jgi:hypothetical protein
LSTTDDNKALILRFYELVINQHRLNAIEGLLSKDFVHNGEKRGTKGQRDAIEALLTAMPDITVVTGVGDLRRRPGSGAADVDGDT